jgi:hypothetical protein
MESPDPERKAGADTERPDFDRLTPPDELVRRGKTRDRIYTTVLQLFDPAPVAEVAERSDADSGTTREYLRWFADLGVIRRVGADPERYVANREYLQWRRANKLSEEYRESELVRRLQDVTEEIEDYRGEFDAETARNVDITETADAREDAVADVWDKISDWETAEQRRETLQLALRIRRKSRDQFDTDPISSTGTGANPDAVQY